ncbi:helix-turn-helix transcriptional regulator [Clostridium sp. P21]|uniref:Helix-turn-helix transcriptional regulator n=1 Tax=Clostridium muellerianum TaxID=2716538 RepID=A0A7Y0EEQ5_9CLOT|nr:helix-turn-helix transcriptional regulator [Clostridium muellerianum]NMM62062.1 helix-turn-helix transcriptional regulator [Clostridium muellerianum]
MNGNTLKKLRLKENLTQEQLGKKIGVSGAYIQQLEKGKKDNPSLDILNKIAETLKIPVNKLLGNLTWGTRLKNLREKKQLTEYNLAKELNISIDDILDYEKGTEPDIETLREIAKFFGVTTDYLIGESDYQTPEDESLLKAAKSHVEYWDYNFYHELDIIEEHITTIKENIKEETAKLNEALVNYYKSHIDIERRKEFNILINVIHDLTKFTNFIVELSKDDNFKYFINSELLTKSLVNSAIDPTKQLQALNEFHLKTFSMPHISESTFKNLKTLEELYTKNIDTSVNIIKFYSLLKKK